MTTLDHHSGVDSHQLPSPSSPSLSTAWMPLDGLIQQWADFGAEATSAPALQAASAVFAALARETEALGHWMADDRPGTRATDLTDLEQAVEQLHQAQQHWSEAIGSLHLLALDSYGSRTAQEAIRLLVAAAMGQRMRLSLLLHEVAGEQLVAYRALPASSSPRKEGRR